MIPRAGTGTEIPPADVGEHAAVRAWRWLGEGGRPVESIVVLKSKRKTAVYRLMGAGRGGTSVIAKRCHSLVARLEWTIYRDILTQLGLPSLRCHGYFQETDGPFGWIFLEEARGRDYVLGDAEHRLLAGRWLAALHNVSLDPTVTGVLPSRGADHYLEKLRWSRSLVMRHMGNPALRARERCALTSIVSRLDVVESHWHEVESFCAGLPCTLVHGDVVVKNVRVRSGPAGPELLVFDWGASGWGVSGADLCQSIDRTLSPDLPAYCASLVRRRRSPDLARVRRLALYGGVFRVLDEIGWAASGLRFESRDLVVETVWCLKIYDSSLSAVLQATGWTGCVGRS